MAMPQETNQKHLDDALREDHEPTEESKDGHHVLAPPTSGEEPSSNSSQKTEQPPGVSVTEQDRVAAVANYSSKYASRRVPGQGNDNPEEPLPFFSRQMYSPISLQEHLIDGDELLPPTIYQEMSSPIPSKFLVAGSSVAESRPSSALIEGSPMSMEESSVDVNSVDPTAVKGSTQSPGATASEGDRTTLSAQDFSTPGSSKDSVPCNNDRITEQRAVAAATQDASQPGCSKDSTPWTDAGPSGEPGAPRVPQQALQPGYTKGASASSKGSPGKRVKEPGEIDPEALFDDACKKIPGLVHFKRDAISYSAWRTYSSTCDQVRDKIYQYCAKRAKTERHRAWMLDTLREKLAEECPAFVWNKDTEQGPVIEEPAKKTVKKNPEKKKGMPSTPASSERFRVGQKLKRIWSKLDKNSPADIETMKKHLEDTFEQRRSGRVENLHAYGFFLEEDILCKEAELRFGSEISVLEAKLTAAVTAFSETLNQENTFTWFCNYLEDREGHASLITQSPVPESFTGEGPRIYLADGGVQVVGSTPMEKIPIASGRMERALVLCLAVYYIKNLAYPRAFERVLYVLQRILNPSDVLPVKVEVTNRMRHFINLLKYKGMISEREPV